MVEGKAASTSHVSSRGILGNSDLNNGKSAEAFKPVAQPPEQPCPQCGSKGPFYKDGLRYLRDGSIRQRWLCRNCSFRFSKSPANSNIEINVGCQSFEQSHSRKNLLQSKILQSKLAVKPSVENLSLKFCEDVGSHGISEQTILEKPLYAFPDYTRERRVCATQRRAKNLSAATELKTVAGEERTQQDVKGKIVEFAFHLKKQGRAQDTIKSYVSVLSSLTTEGANLFSPESVKEVLALNDTWNNTTKTTKTIVYDRFAGFLGLKWDKPKYKAQKKLPFIPTEQEIDALIAASPKKTAAILQLLKETAARIGEACKLEWIDLNEKAMTVTINCPEKNSNPRICKVSNKLIGMLNALPRKSKAIFHKTNGKTAQLCLSRARQKVAMKLQSPRINQITHHTLRHWKATMSYHETKDILHVQQLLGHKKIDSTLIYVNLESAIFQTENDNFHVKTATTPEEITQLLEVGFEYVCQKDGLIFLRKRK